MSRHVYSIFRIFLADRFLGVEERSMCLRGIGYTYCNEVHKAARHVSFSQSRFDDLLTLALIPKGYLTCVDI